MRVKSGTTRHKQHAEVRKRAKGMQHTHRSSPRRARQAVTRAEAYQYRDRRNKKRDFRRLWISRINAAARQHGTSYAQLMNALDGAGIQLDRKVLADLAVNQPHVFEQIVQTASGE